MKRKSVIEHHRKAESKPTPKLTPTQPQNKVKPIKPTQQPLNSETIRDAQQMVGNKVVQRIIQRQALSKGGSVREETADTIHCTRGQGQALDESIANKVGTALGQDFSDVTVHTDETADQLNKDVGAKAFTTGKDIFFSSGTYAPQSQDGQHLIAHELTHVVQQDASPPAVQTKMTVNEPNDQYEVEADKVADQVIRQPEIQRQEDEEEMTMGKWEVQRQEDEEEMAMGKWIQREEAPVEDEEV